MKVLPFKLLPEKDVFAENGHFYALSSRPWLQIAPEHPFISGQIIEIIHRSSLWDEPVRPIFRFWFDGNDYKDVAGTAPIAGAACATIEIPENTSRLSVCPAKETGQFDFIIEDIRICSRLDILKKLLSGGTSRPWFRIIESLFGLKSRRALELDWGLGSTSILHFPNWLERNCRKAELDGCDAPRCDWAQIPDIQLFMHLETADLTSCADTVKSLQAQILSRWRLNIIAAAGIDYMPPDPRVNLVKKEDAVHLMLSLSPQTLAGSLREGDLLYSDALAMIVEAQARHPAALVFYGDECAMKATCPAYPILKPGWSPLLAPESAYLGQAVFIRGTQLEDAKTGLAESGRLNGSLLPDLSAEQVHSLKRFVLKTARPEKIRAAAPSPPFATTEINPSAMIVIPTRDQTDLLGRCLRSIFERTRFQNYSIIIVDNDSVELASKKFFKTFFGDKIVSVSHSPGPFNFSALCNAGASRRRPDVLVFLKNYVEIRSEDWLTRLMAHALFPEAGAVGPEALYQGCRLPKALDAFMPFKKTAHEVLAVSADCLAVSRRKFLLNGGFDAAHFPNGLQHLDFCLRLRERGLISRADPGVGVGIDDAPKIAASPEERALFQARWCSSMRDDPYFHPGLSPFFANGGVLGQ